MRVLVLIFGVWNLFSILAFGQYNIGIGTNILSSRLYNISKEAIHSYGFSGADFDQKFSLVVSPYVCVRKTFRNNLGLELGIGFIGFKHKLELDYYYPFFQKQVKETLSIALDYINLPISLLYGVNINEHTKLVFIGKIIPKLLIRYDDNFQEIIIEKIYLFPDKYKRSVWATNISVGFQKTIQKNNILEFDFFGGLDMNSFIKEKSRWGFYTNLYQSRNVQFGISLKYLFINL